MGYWRVLVPLATKNYLSNPSFERSTDGVTEYKGGAAAGTLERSSAYQTRGVYSLAITKSAGAVGDDYGFYTTADHLSEFEADDLVALRVDLKTNDAVTVTVKLESDVAEGTETFVGPGENRVGLSVTLPGAPGFLVVYVYIDSGATGTVYVDGMMLERNTETEYCDGDQPGCTWLGAAHASPSIRDGRSRAGGAFLDLDDVAFYVEEAYGIGFPPLSHIVQQQALLPGALYVDSKVTERALTLVGTLVGTSRTNLHSRRRQLVDLFKPDGGDGPVILAYTGAGHWAQIPVVYDSGLTFEEIDGFSERIMLRLIAYDPFWRAALTRGAVLELAQALSNANSIIRRVAGEWKALATGFASGGTVRAIVPYGTGMVVGGSFTSVDGDACYGTALWNPVTEDWTVLDTDSDGDGVNALAVYGHHLYAGGSFTQKDGVADTAYLARWTYLSGGEWTKAVTLGAPNGAVTAMAVSPQGYLYVAGAFTQIGGQARDRMARINGSTSYTMVPPAGLSALAPLALACGPDGALYVSGSVSSGDTPIYKFMLDTDGITPIWTDLGDAVHASGAVINALAVGPDGMLYAGGLFTSIGGLNTFNIARWNGAAWEDIGGANDEVHELYFDKDGLLYVSGEFTAVGGYGLVVYAPLRTPSGLAIWNGSTWANVGATLPASSLVRAFAFDDAGTLYLGYDQTGSAGTSVKTSLSVQSTRTEYPTITIRRLDTDPDDTASVQLIRNRSTGATLYLNYDLAGDESLTIDLTPGARDVRSSIYGRVWRALLRNSDVAAWNLLPGTNELETYVALTGSADVEIAVTYTPSHWSVDGDADEISWW